MIVTVSGLSGLTNAYVSVLSATGSLLISGASRCDDMATPLVLSRSCLWSASPVEQPLHQHGISVCRLARPVHHGHLTAPGVANVRHDRLARARTRRLGDHWLRFGGRGCGWAGLWGRRGLS